MLSSEMSRRESKYPSYDSIIYQLFLILDFNTLSLFSEEDIKLSSETLNIKLKDSENNIFFNELQPSDKTAL